MNKIESGKNYIQYEDETILIKGVRLSFPHIATSYQGKNDSFGFKLLVNKEEQTELLSFLKKIIRSKFEELKVKRLPLDKLFLRDGDDSERENEHGHYIISGNSRRPIVAIDRNGHIMKDADEIESTFYAGCYVNAVIKIWVQNDKEYGKRVNANANAVQFIKDGEQLGTVFRPENYDWDVIDDDELSSKSSKSKSKSKQIEDDDDEDIF
jgi:hypothetical protein